MIKIDEMTLSIADDNVIDADFSLDNACAITFLVL